MDESDLMRKFFYRQSDAVSSKAKNKWEEIVQASYECGDETVIWNDAL